MTRRQYQWSKEAERIPPRRKSVVSGGVTQRTHKSTQSESKLSGKSSFKGKSIPSADCVLCVTIQAAAKFGISADALARTVTRLPWQRGLFELARLLRPEADRVGITPEANIGVLEDVVREWHEEARPPGTPFAPTWNEFLVAYGKVKHPAGSGPFDVALKQARIQAAALGHEDYGEPETVLLLCLAWQLQRVKDGPFPLSARVAERACRFPDRMTAWRRLVMLQRDGWLRQVQEGTRMKAARYTCRLAKRLRETQDGLSDTPR